MNAAKEALRNTALTSSFRAAADAGRLAYAAGGKNLLGEPFKAIVRGELEAVGRHTLSEVVHVVGEASKATGKAIVETAGREVGKTAGKELAKTAGRELARAAGRASLVGGLVDLGFGAVEGARGCARGEKTAREAVKHAALEGGTGAAASAAGVVAIASATAVVGSLTLGPLLFIGGGTAFAVKSGLKALL